MLIDEDMKFKFSSQGRPSCVSNCYVTCFYPFDILRQAPEWEIGIVAANSKAWKERLRCIDSSRQAMICARQKATVHRANYYNLRHRNIEFRERQSVLTEAHHLSNAGKRFRATLEKSFDGPYIISRKLSPARYELSSLIEKYLGQTAIKELKPWISPE